MASIRLSATQRALLDLLHGTEESGRIRRRPAGANRAPLSFGQERLWFLDQFQPGLPLYIMLGTVSFRSPSDVTAVRRAVDEVVHRHGALRTIFAQTDDQLEQITLPPHPMLLDATDLRGADPVAASQLSQRIFQREGRRAFDLANGPLFRAHLLQLPMDHDLLIFAVHHIVSDGWSMSLIRREIEEAYARIVQGLPIRRDNPPLQYADYAIWQREQLTSDTIADLRRYWGTALAGARAVSLPATDRPAPAQETGAGANRPFRIPAKLAAALTDLGHREDATIFMVLLAGLTALLYRHGGERDWVIGTPAANRETTELEAAVGFLVNTVPIRVQVDPGGSFRAHLAHVRSQALAAFDHQALPFEQIVDEVRPQRNLGHNPLFQVMLALQNMPDRQAVSGEDWATQTAPEECVARFGLGWFLAPNGDDLIGSVEYSTDLYDHDRIARMIGHFQALLAAVAADADVPVARIDCLPPAEHARLTDWAGGDVDTPEAGGLHAFFERTAAARPDAPALRAGDETLTYTELDRRADLVAAALCARGIGAEDRVGICLRRTAWSPACVLGILKAGATCVPIDPALPKGRIAFMLEDAQVRIVLSDPSAELDGLACARLDVGDDLAASQPRPDRATLPSQLAYVVYTSGSTGRPKGVALPHAALTNLIAWQSRHSGDPALRTAHFASLSFDVAFQEMFSTWAIGGCLYIVPEEIRADPAGLAAWIVANDVTRAFFPPLVWRELALATQDALPLREVITAGEALQITPAIARLCQRSAIALVNHYGPSETHVVTSHRLQGTPASWPIRPPIGQPIANCRAYVLAPDLMPTPIGVPGELYLAGAGLARGYLGRPDLTAERFLPDPFGPPGARMYRTGDVARWLDDGALDYLGRTDSQVKIRGFRVELEEVEAQLRACPGVEEAAVVLRNDPQMASATLVGFYEAPASIDAAAVRTSLREHLPDYMVPPLLIRTEQLPRLINGKIDRLALPSDLARATRETVPPRNESERRLAAIWSAVLNRDQIGIHDDFFELGGHSLLATQVISRACRDLGGNFTVRDLFETPTVAAFAARIEAPATSELPEAREAGAEAGPSTAGPLSFGQERLWFLHQLAPESPIYNLGELIHFDGAYVPSALDEAWTELAERHPGLRTRFVQHAEGPWQEVLPSGPLAVRRVSLEEVAPTMREGEIDLIRERERRQSFDLGAGPPIVGVIAIPSATEHVLILTMHHILADGWSLGILREELSALYNARRNGATPALPAAPPSPIAFSRSLRCKFTDDAAADGLDFWKRALAGAPSEIDLPFDRPRNTEPFGPGAVQTFALSGNTRAGLLALSRNENASMFMVLLAGFAAMLARYDRGGDFPIGVPVGNRDDPEFERTIGFFVNTIVMRALVRPGSSFRDLVRDIRERVLAALSHQHVPFERVVEAVRPLRGAGVHPLFHVMFFLNHAASDGSRQPEIVLGPAGVDDDALNIREIGAKFDLTLGYEDGAEGLIGAFEYRTDLFTHWTIWRMSRVVRQLLAAAAHDPDRPLDTLELMDADERAFTRQALGDASTLRSDAHTLTGLVAAAVARNPAGIAIAHGETALRYDELWRRAGAVARQLRACASPREGIVGILLPPSPDLVVAMLGILMAGGAYLAIDPALPAQRRRTMLRGVTAVIAAAGDAEADLAEVPVIHLPTEASPGDDDVPSEVDPRQAAYVIYTSGSVGQPRAVIVEHRAAATYVKGAMAEFGLTQASRVLQFTSPSFDVAVEEIFATLAAGATLVIRPGDRLTSLHDFISACRRDAIDVLILPTAFWHQLVPELAESGVPPALKLVVIGGEQASAAQLAAWHASVPRTVRLLNAYGPTEATVSATYADLTAPLAPHPRPPIGRPVAGACAYVLDERLEWTPPGVPGELHVGGITLARGYRDDPAETALRFLPDPFGPPGSRMYCTRDKVILRGDGMLTFVGRNDDMAKVRGFRVELGEIDAALRALPGVVAAAAALRPSSGDIVAAVETDDPALAERALLDALALVLPYYMVPAGIALTPAIPLTPGGKPDRRAVAMLCGLKSTAQGEPPRDAREAKVAEIWADVIGIPMVHRDDDFFDLGGHSLMATQVVARLRAHFDVDVSIRQLFEARTVAALAAGLPEPRTADAPAGKEEEARASIIPRNASPGLAPVSFAQERLLFIHRLTGGAPLYNLPVVIPSHGPFNPAPMRAALALLFERHEILRTAFVEIDGRQYQRVEDPPACPMAFVDLGDVPPTQRDAELSRIAAAEARQPFDLEGGQVARALLVRVADDHHVLLLTMHHIVADGWAVNILRRELAEAYDALSVGMTPKLAMLPATYADYATWQRDRLTPDFLREAIAWWASALDGADDKLQMPLDMPRRAKPSFEGHWRLFSVSARTTDQLTRLAKAQGASLFMAVMTAFQIVVARWSDLDDIVVGTPLAGREDLALEGLVGTFVNTVPIRTRFLRSESFREVLDRVRGTSLSAYAHGNLPFERLVEEIKPRRALDVSPIFQVVLALQNLPRGAERTLDPSGATDDFVGTCTAKYDLSVSLDMAGGGLVGYAEYACDIFRDSTIQRLIATFVRTLDAFAEDPDLPISALSQITPAERLQLTSRWATGPAVRSGSGDGDVLHAITRWARRAPNAHAICEGELNLGYAELVERAGEIGARLRALGLGREAIVAVRMPRSIAFVVACTGALWAGAAFLPIDPAHPPARVEAIMRDSGAALLLELDGLSLGLADIPLAALDRMGRVVTGLDEAAGSRATPSFAHPEQLAYVIYTSGSTGRPKGVAIPHRGLRNLCQWYRDRLGLDRSDRFSFTSSPSFDAAISEVWPALCAGATLDIVDDDLKLAPERLARWQRERGVSISFLVTPLAEAYAGVGGAAGSRLRWLLTGGDRLTRRPDPSARYRLLNQYGPTECSVCATAVEVHAEGDGVPPIGTPIGGARCYVLDEALEPVPVGASGQLYIGGSGLGRGYWSQPGLTAAAFLPDPFGPPGARMYATGDRVRWDDGTLYFLGRLDRQVKVRGFRIELAEIETALAAISHGPAAVRVGRGGELVGYVTGAAGDASRIIAALRERLPAHLVPARLIPIEAIPTTSNDKIDDDALDALDALDQAKSPAEDGRLPALNAIERGIEGLWAELLGIGGFAAADDFFAQGGHSLLLAQLAARISFEFGIDVPLRVLFQDVTLEAMAFEVLVRLIESMPAGVAEQLLVPEDAQDLAETGIETVG
jgi:amino acid adenylation domain-containing protein